MNKKGGKVKGKQADTGSDWIEVKGMCKCEHRFMVIIRSDFVCPATQVSNIFKRI